MDNVEGLTPPGVYANTLNVGYNAYEFVLEFGVVAPEDTAPRIHTRIITSPMLAGAFACLLEQSLQE